MKRHDEISKMAASVAVRAKYQQLIFLSAHIIHHVCMFFDALGAWSHCVRQLRLTRRNTRRECRPFVRYEVSYMPTRRIIRARRLRMHGNAPSHRQRCGPASVSARRSLAIAQLEPSHHQRPTAAPLYAIGYDGGFLVSEASGGQSHNSCAPGRPSCGSTAQAKRRRHRRAPALLAHNRCWPRVHDHTAQRTIVASDTFAKAVQPARATSKSVPSAFPRRKKRMTAHR